MSIRGAVPVRPSRSSSSTKCIRLRVGSKCGIKCASKGLNSSSQHFVAPLRPHTSSVTPSRSTSSVLILPCERPASRCRACEAIVDAVVGTPRVLLHLDRRPRRPPKLRRELCRELRRSQLPRDLCRELHRSSSRQRPRRSYPFQFTAKFSV